METSSSDKSKKVGQFVTSIRMNELPLLDQPYEKLEVQGERFLTDTELLSILLRTGTRGSPAIAVAQKIQSLDFRKQGISFLCNIPIEDLKQIPGVGRIKAIMIKAGVEIGRRIARTSLQNGETIIRTPADVANHLQEEMRQLGCEELRILLLDNKNALIRIIKSASGGIRTTMFSPREIFKDAFRYNAASMILVHNHPSGNPTPSRSDFDTTHSLSAIAKDLDIPILDHVIIGRDGYESIQEILKKNRDTEHQEEWTVRSRSVPC